MINFAKLYVSTLCVFYFHVIRVILDFHWSRAVHYYSTHTDDVIRWRDTLEQNVFAGFALFI